MAVAIQLLGETSPVFAVTCGDGASPDRREDAKVGGWDIQIDAASSCRGGRVDLVATRDAGPSTSGGKVPGGSGGGIGAPAANAFLSVPIFCRRDDYMFLPPGALGGIPCLGVTESQPFDPEPFAARLAAAIPPPDLRIRMNPQRGMVRVPTWFWVEGYDGGSIGQSQAVVQQHSICHMVADRGDDGLAVLDSSGRPRSHQECTIETTTFLVAVQLSPSNYAWDFGDSQRKSVACAGGNDCPNALGQPYMATARQSPVEHPYVLSSLDPTSGATAYTVGLAITFAAEYRVSVNGADQGGWHSLPARTLTWSAAHEVREAQAVIAHS